MNSYCLKFLHTWYIIAKCFRGVVQLFNAVRRQQKLVEDKLSEVGPSERKQAKVMEKLSKSDFLDILKGSESKQKKDKNVPKTDDSVSVSESFKNKSVLGAIVMY